jgi:hypothetical protein
MLKTKGRKYIEINKQSEDGNRWIENIGTAWRRIGFSDDIANLQHGGWFTDNFQDEVLRGIVYKLPTRKSGPVYFVGYADPNNEDSARGQIRTDLEDDNAAAYYADNIAETAAESEREYNEAWRLGTKYANTFEVVESQRAIRSNLFAELRKIKSTLSENETPTICDTLKAKIRSARRNIKAALQERREIIRDNWISGGLLSSFADGADISSDEAKSLF